MTDHTTEPPLTDEQREHLELISQSVQPMDLFTHGDIVAVRAVAARLAWLESREAERKQSRERQGTHWENCWRAHPSCAVAKVEEMMVERERLTAELRHANEYRELSVLGYRRVIWGPKEAT